MRLSPLWMLSPLLLSLPVSITQCEDPPPEYGPDVPLAACDMAPYELLPRLEVGLLLDFEELPGYNLEPDQIDALLAEAEWTWFSPVPYGSRIFRYRYTTQDRGIATEATALLGIPANAEIPEAPFPTDLYLHGTTGFSDPCAPSGMMEGPAVPAVMTSLGFITISPDYIGLNGMGEPATTPHAYLVGEQIALGSWDAIRAGHGLLTQLRNTGVTADERVVIWGPSQGGHAALFTELYGPYYAPEFDVQAVVAMVPPSDLTALLVEAMANFSEDLDGLLMASITAMRSWYDAPSDLYGVLTNVDPYYLADNAESYVYVEGEECNPMDGIEADEVSDIYIPEFSSAVLDGRWEDVSPWGCYFDENSLATSSVPPLRATPTLMVYGENDTLVVTSTQVPDFDQLCEQGYQLDYYECAGAGHVDGATWSLPEQYDWLQARLAGEPIPQAEVCLRQAPVCCQGSPENVCVP